ncbi:hypothetical protein C3K47_17860 [Solitalea longa]|uniref:Thioredoxin domain-containing protein n=1 Tax=Solitalea longa TaxID=2079460 RepID=A0A2S4ZX76_9SPHI|nr:hypothetical protein [Solitalea longa]POY34968.1 hypothetical protein C3K47_17860 [Solitalea longa]
MKKLLSITLLLALVCTFANAQLTNTNWPTGYYKISVKDYDLKLYLFDNNRFYVNTNVANQFSNTLKGTYTSLNDTLIFAGDTPYSSFKVLQKKGKLINNKLSITICVSEYLSNDIKLMIGKTYNNTKLINLDTVNHQDSIYTLEHKVSAGDKIFISYLNYKTKANFQEFPINSGVNEIKLTHVEDFGLAVWNTLVGHEGESKNELVITDRKSPLSFYYIRPINSDDLPVSEPEKQATAPRGYSYLVASRTFRDSTLEIKTDYDYTATPTFDSVANAADNYYDDYKRDTVFNYTNYDDALKQAKTQNKFLVMYYEPSNCVSCTGKIAETMQLVNRGYSYSSVAENVNKHYVFYQVPESDKNRLREYGVKKFPALVILTSEEELLHYASGPDNAKQLNKLFDYYTNFHDKLNLQFVNTVLPERVEKSNYEKETVKTFLLESAKSKKTVFYNDYETVVEEPSKDEVNANFESPINTKFDTVRVVRSLDTLLMQSDLKGKVDTSLAKLIVQMVMTTDETYCPLMNSVFLNANDQSFKVSPAFNYLLSNYNELSKYDFPSDFTDSYDYNEVSLYQVISDRVKRTVYSANSAEACKNAIAFQQVFTNQTPEVKFLETPLLLHNINYYLDSLKLTDSFINVSVNFFDSFITKPETALSAIDKIYSELTVSQSKAFKYSLNNNAYTLTGDYCNSESDKKCFAQLIGSSLNTSAWGFYTHKVDKNLLKKALTWSKTSLMIEKDNPYYIDTYAHLLYKLGNKEEALKQQEIAVTKASNKKSDYYIEEDIFKSMKADLQKMKTGTL